MGRKLTVYEEDKLKLFDGVVGVSHVTRHLEPQSRVLTGHCQQLPVHVQYIQTKKKAVMGEAGLQRSFE